MQGLQLGIWDSFIDFFKALFNLIPKVIYLLYSSFACILDILQLLFRKLAGLDVYYIDGKPVGGDIVTNFISGILGIKLDKNNSMDYSALATVFWSFVIFGLIILFAATIIAVLKSHYNYDDKAKKGPMQYVYTAIRSAVSMAVVPILCVLGLYVSQAVLTALDSITTSSSTEVVAQYGAQKSLLQTVNVARNVDPETGGVVDDKDVTYIYYDIFGFSSAVAYGNSYSPNGLEWSGVKVRSLAYIGSTNTTFSGMLFKLSGYNANRARNERWDPATSTVTGTRNSNMKLFAEAKDYEELANMIDDAFANNLHLKESFNLDHSANQVESLTFFTNFLTNWTGAFSKFNVGAVWYYYDLWQFNFILGFGACTVCLTIFLGIIFGLITRLFFCIGLFLVAPPLFGLAPLDGGKAQGQWKDNFVQQVLMAYGAVVGMNLFFIILPYFHQIQFFNIAIADYFMQTLIIIVGLITIKAFIATISKIIGAADAYKTGEDVKEQVAGAMGKGISMTMGAAKLGAKAFGGVAKLGVKATDKTIGLGAKLVGLDGAYKSVKTGIKTGINKLGNRITGKTKSGLVAAEKNQRDLNDAAMQDEILQDLDGVKASKITEGQIRRMAKSKNLSAEATNNLINAVNDAKTAAGSGSLSLNGANGLREKLNSKGGTYATYGNAGGFDTKAHKAALKTAQTNIERAQARRAAMGRVTFAKGFSSAMSKAGNVKDSVFSLAYDLYGKDKFTESFLHESGLRKKANFEKDTASNTKAMLEQMQNQNASSSKSSQALAEQLEAQHEEQKAIQSGQSKTQDDALTEQRYQSYLAEWKELNPGKNPTAADMKMLRDMAKKR